MSATPSDLSFLARQTRQGRLLRALGSSKLLQRWLGATRVVALLKAARGTRRDFRHLGGIRLGVYLPPVWPASLQPTLLRIARLIRAGFPLQIVTTHFAEPTAPRPRCRFPHSGSPERSTPQTQEASGSGEIRTSPRCACPPTQMPAAFPVRSCAHSNSPEAGRQ